MAVFKKALAVAACATLWVAAPSQAATWPDDQVRIIVPYPPGTEPDILARDLSAQLNKQTGQVIVIENRPGANAIIGTDVVAKAKGDGKTLLMIDRLALVTNPLLYKKLPYDWLSDLKPVTNVGRVNLYLSAKGDLPVNSYQDLINAAKKTPGSINVATGGKGHVTHLGMASVAQAEDLSLTYVPYKGVAPAMTGLLGGEVDIMLAGGVSTLQNYKSGKLKVLAVGADKRSDFMPDVPTIQEAGGKPGSIPSTAFILVAPGDTADDTLDSIKAAVDKVMTVPELRKSYESRGLVIQTTTPAETLAEMKEELKRYTDLVGKLGLQPE